MFTKVLTYLLTYLTARIGKTVVEVGQDAAELRSGAPINCLRPFRGPSITNSCQNAVLRYLMLRKSVSYALVSFLNKL